MYLANESNIRGKFSRPKPMRTWWSPNWNTLEGASMMPVSATSRSQKV